MANSTSSNAANSCLRAKHNSSPRCSACLASANRSCALSRSATAVRNTARALSTTVMRTYHCNIGRHGIFGSGQLRGPATAACCWLVATYLVPHLARYAPMEPKHPAARWQQKGEGRARGSARKARCGSETSRRRVGLPGPAIRAACQKSNGPQENCCRLIPPQKALQGRFSLGVLSPLPRTRLCDRAAGCRGMGRRPVAPIGVEIARRPVQPQCGALPFGARHGLLRTPARSSRAAAANACMFAVRSALPVAKVTARSAGPAIARQVCPAGSP